MAKESSGAPPASRYHLDRATQKGAPHHGTAVAPELVHPRARASRSVLAPSDLLAAVIDRYSLLPGFGAAGRGRALRFNLPRRSAGARWGCHAGAAHLA